MHKKHSRQKRVRIRSRFRASSRKIRHLLQPTKRLLGRKSREQWITVVVLAAAGLVVGHWLSSMQAFAGLRGTIYQTVVRPVSTSVPPTHTITVLLDDVDYWSPAADPDKPSLAGRVPVDRFYLAALLRKLSEARAPVVAFDIDLRSPLPPGSDLPPYKAEDEALFQAIRNAHPPQPPPNPENPPPTTKVVLGTSLLSTSNGPVAVANIYDRAELGTWATRGFIQIPRDIRQAPGIETLAGSEGHSVSFALAAVNAICPAKYRVALANSKADFPYSRFMPESSFRTAGTRAILSGRDVLGLPDRELQMIVAGKVVLIGAHWHTLAYWQGPYIDQHPSPANDMPGVLLQANYIEAMLDGTMVKSVSETQAIIFDIGLELLLALVSLLEIHYALKGFFVIASLVAVIALTYVSVSRFGVFLDFFFPILFVGVGLLYEHLKPVSERHHQMKSPEKTV